MSKEDQQPSPQRSGGSFIKATPVGGGRYACGFTGCLSPHDAEVDALACARIRLAYEVRDLAGRDDEGAGRLAARLREFDAARPDVVMRAAQVNAGRMVESLLELREAAERGRVSLTRRERHTVRRAFSLLARVSKGEEVGEGDSPVDAYTRARNVFSKYLVRR